MPRINEKNYQKALAKMIKKAKTKAKIEAKKIAELKKPFEHLL